MNTENNDQSKEDIRRTLDIFKAYKKTQEAQETRGLNDFNVFTSLLDASDEVRLHSRFLCTLLDPHGTHGQRNLFLDLFLQEVGLSKLNIDTRSCKVYKEYNNIDLYITDGRKHIIIENKIYAGDQHHQIERYIDTIKAENKDDQDFSENLIIIYLSLDRLQPSEYSLGSFKYADKMVTRGNANYRLLPITYKKEILSWINTSEEQVANITNLSVGLMQYKEVILKLYNIYKGKLMNLKDYVEMQDDSLATLKTIWEINDDYPSLKKDVVIEFFESVKTELLKSIGSSDDWEIVINEAGLDKKYKHPFTIQQSPKSKVFFCLEFGRDDYFDSYYGVKRRDDTVDLDALKKHLEIKPLLDKIASPLPRSEAWWLSWGWYYKGDLLKRILDDGGTKQAADVFTKKLLSAFELYKDTIMKCNDVLAAS